MKFVRINEIWAFGVVSALALGCGDDNSAGTTGNTASGTSGGTVGDADGTAGSASNSGGDTTSGGSISASASGGSTSSAGTDDDTATSGSSADEGSTTAQGTDGSTGGGSTDGGSTGGTTGMVSGGTTTGNNTGNNEDCEAPGDLMPCDDQTTDPFQAIGLNCPGDANTAIPIFNESFTSTDPNAWKIARQYGTYVDQQTNEPIWGPQEGEQFLIISTGVLDDPDAQGVLTMSAGSFDSGLDNGNPGNQQLPAPMVADDGSNNGAGGTPFVNCDGIGDCSDSLEAQWAAGNSAANDLLWFQFEVDVPGGTHGFSFDFSYFSGEFPEWVNTQYNDIFVVWSNSETYTGNLCFVNDQPCTVTALWPVQYQAQAPELAGTGFDSAGFDDAGATGWFNAKASAEPFETLQLTWAVFDMGDSVWDTAVLIDNWRWDCEGCVPSEVNGCGIEPT